MRYPGEKWIHITAAGPCRLGVLTCGIFLGAHWAYSVLDGWGTGAGSGRERIADAVVDRTAFLHSVMMQKSAAC